MNPEQFGISVTTVSGQHLSIGDSDVPFCIQSCSKPISYCMALEEHGSAKVHSQHEEEVACLSAKIYQLEDEKVGLQSALIAQAADLEVLMEAVQTGPVPSVPVRPPPFTMLAD